MDFKGELLQFVGNGSIFLLFAEGQIRLWSFTTTDHIQGVVKFEIGESK